jgi:serralysin
MARFVGGVGRDRFVGVDGARDVFIGLQERDAFRGNDPNDVVDYSQDIHFGAIRGVKVNLSGQARSGLLPDTARDSFGFIDRVAGVPNAIGTVFGDTIHGGGSANALTGLAGRDSLLGHQGNDRLNGGLGADQLFGGLGADAFVFAKIGESTVGRGGRDTIHDFSQVDGDLINLRGIDAMSRPAGNQTFTFIEDAAFTGRAGELRYQVSGATTFVFGDVNGDRRADFAIALKGIFDLGTGDFVL